MGSGRSVTPQDMGSRAGDGESSLCDEAQPLLLPRTPPHGDACGFVWQGLCGELAKQALRMSQWASHARGKQSRRQTLRAACVAWMNSARTEMRIVTKKWRARGWEEFARVLQE